MESQKVALWVIIGVLLLAVVYTVFFQGGSTTSTSLSSTAGQTASAYSGMVGGCQDEKKESLFNVRLICDYYLGSYLYFK